MKIIRLAADGAPSVLVPRISDDLASRQRRGDWREATVSRCQLGWPPATFLHCSAAGILHLSTRGNGFQGGLDFSAHPSICSRLERDIPYGTCLSGGSPLILGPVLGVRTPVGLLIE